VTALLVAWPFVPGEDPGQLSQGTGTAGMVLTLLWLVTAVGWAVWRLWARQGDWYAGLVDLGLFATVAVVFLTAEASARYKHPARLIAWEWIGLFVAFCVVRQLAVSADERHGLFSALLATTVALAAYGVFQATVEHPSPVEQTAESPFPVGDEPASDAQSPPDVHVHGTFRHSDSFAGYLALFLPGLVAALVVCRGNGLPRWQTVFAAAFALLGAAALVLTHSRGAILATVAVGLGVAVILGREWLLRHRIAAVGGAVVLAVSGYLLIPLGLTSGEADWWRELFEAWRGTRAMIANRPWLGVGPGNFGRAYPSFMGEAAAGKLSDPRDFALEVWATSGVFALLALVATLAVFFVQVVRWLKSAKPQVAKTTDEPTTEPPLRWEFYLGGMFGLLLGFVLRVGDRDPSAILTEGFLAGGRSLVWFASFALFEQLVWPERVRVTALAGGVAALLLALTMSGGIGFPSVAGPLWVVVALALNGLNPTPLAVVARLGVLRALPVPALTAVAMLYFLYVFYPVTAAENSTRKALTAGRFYLEDRERKEDERQIKGSPSAYLRNRVIGRLREAAGLDPDNARTFVHLANWYGELWSATRPVGPSSANQNSLHDALDHSGAAEKRDPEGTAPLLARWQLYRLAAGVFTDQAARSRKEREKETDTKKKENLARQVHILQKYATQYNELAVAPLRRLTQLDPSDAGLCYRLAEALFQADKKEAAREEARAALRLDETTHPARKLSNEQREQLQKWLGTAPPG
jgi:O-antigen ligase